MAGKNDLIMKIISFYIFIFISLMSFAQNNDIIYHDNINKICYYVKTLRDTPEMYEDVSKMMKDDYSWKIMSEFYENCINQENICSVFDDVKITGINDRAYQIEMSRGNIPQSSDNFCAGTDFKSNFLFYECSVLSENNISTFLNGRSGKQMFVIMPFEQECISVAISLNGKNIDSVINNSGHICIVINEDVDENDIIEIKVSNESEKNQSFVIINHNTVE